MKCSALWIGVVVMVPISAGAASMSADLPAMVSRLRSNPRDDVLREQVIEFMRELCPPPAVPDEARRHQERAKFLLRTARTGDEYRSAARELEQAVALAPWYAPAYLALGDAYEKAGDRAQVENVSGSYAEAWRGEDAWRLARENLKWYELADDVAGDPGDSRARVERRRAELELKIWKWREEWETECGGCRMVPGAPAQ